MASFIELVKLSTLSPNNEVRQQNEARLLEYWKVEPLNFLGDALSSFKDENLDLGLRQAAGTILKVSLSLEVVPGKGPQWYVISPEHKQTSRMACLELLIHKTDIIKNTAADLISAMFVLDYETNGWPDLLANLSRNASMEDESIQKSAITTIGYICEKLAQNPKLKPSEQDINNFIVAIIPGLAETQKNEDIRLTAIKALQDMIPLFKPKMKEDNIREHFLGAIIQNCSYSAEDVVLKATQCLTDIFKNIYEYLSMRYVTVIADKTLPLLQKSSAISISVMEFWNSLAVFEEKLINRASVGDNTIPCQYFINGCQQVLTESLLRNLLRKDNEEMDSGLSIHAATRECLAHVNYGCQNANSQLNIKFIENYIGNEETKVAALICFEAMVIGAGSNIGPIAGPVEQSFGSMLSIVKSADQRQVAAALRVLSAESEKIPLVLAHNQNFPQWIEVLFMVMTQNVAHVPIVCNILSQTASYVLRNKSQATTQMMEKSIDLGKKLVELSFAPSSIANIHCISEFYSAAMTLSRILDKTEQVEDFMGFLATVLRQASTLSSDARTAVKEGIYTVLITSVYNYKSLLARKAPGGNYSNFVNQKVIGEVYELAKADCFEKSTVFNTAVPTLVAVASRRLANYLSFGVTVPK